jgi:hypothetical protein
MARVKELPPDAALPAALAQAAWGRPRRAPCEEMRRHQPCVCRRPAQACAALVRCSEGAYPASNRCSTRRIASAMEQWPELVAI